MLAASAAIMDFFSEHRVAGAAPQTRRAPTPIYSSFRGKHRFAEDDGHRDAGLVFLLNPLGDFIFGFAFLFLLALAFGKRILVFVLGNSTLPVPQELN